MARDLSNLFSLVSMENLQRDTPMSSITKVLAFDDLGDFVEERERIQRKVQSLLEASPRVDFSTFENHVCFDSALSKFTIAKNKILNQYPYNGSSEDKDLFSISSSLYENAVFKEWPRYVGYLNLASNQYLTASDNTGQLRLGSSSLYVSARILPASSITANVLSVVSGQAGAFYGYELYASAYAVTFRILSGNFTRDFTANLTSSLLGKFSTVAAMYDASTMNVSVYVDASKQASTTSDIAIPNFSTAKIAVGHSYFFSNFTGSIDAVRVLHTASELYHFKNYNRQITSEEFVKLNYHFNEGVVTDPFINSTVIDYSKSALHAQIVNYDANVRVSGSAMASDGDLILYPIHPDVVSYVTNQENAANEYDTANRNYILRLLPEDILRDDQEAGGLLISFALAMARYFDDLKVYLDQFDNLRITNYDEANESPDLMLPLMKKYFGWKVTDHFGDSYPLQFLFGENVAASGSLEVPLLEIKNQFWRRILNNLPYLYKTKGKRDNISSFFNVLGIDKNLINLKEYGFLKYNTITDEFINKEKPFSFLSFGTKATGSYVQATNVITGSQNNEWTMECYTQLPYAKQSYLVNTLSGTLWQIGTGSQGVSFQWQLPAVASVTGTLSLKGTNGQSFSINGVPVFSGQFAHVASGLVSGSLPFITVRVYDNNILTIFSSSVGSASFGAPFTSGPYNVLIGSAGGLQAVGHIGQVRYWNRALSSAELDAHALNPESVAVDDPLRQPANLLGHWGLNEDIPGNNGTIANITDLSRNKKMGQGYNFSYLSSSYDRFLMNYSFVSPSTDLKWTQNKIRIRNQNQLKISDIGNDTNQVALEFNLVDALNEDIAKIFSSIDIMNNVLGAPVNKYRDQYDDLEAYRKVYFERLTTEINFTKFFKLFQWFDQKLASSIKQLLPARVDFIGGEFVVESHFLERNKYKYQYPIFHTPKDIGLGDIGNLVTMSGASTMQVLSSERPLQGTFVRSQFTKDKKANPGVAVAQRFTSYTIEGALSPTFVSRFTDGMERFDRNPDNFFRRKISGDTKNDILSANSSLNFKNEWPRRIADNNAALNKDGYRSGTFIAPQLGNGFVMKGLDTCVNDLHFHGLVKSARLKIRAFSTANQNIIPVFGVTLPTRSVLYDVNNVLITKDMASLFATDTNGSGSTKYEPVFTFYVSGSFRFQPSDLSIYFLDKSGNWYTSIFGIGANSSGNLTPTPIDTIYKPVADGWYKAESRLQNRNGLQLLPKFELSIANSTDSLFQVIVGANTAYTFRDMSLEFSQPLTDYGVQQYEAIDNQNNKKIKMFGNVNRNVLPDSKLPISASNTLYYGWNTVPAPGSDLQFYNPIWHTSVARDGTMYYVFANPNIGIVGSSGSQLYRYTPGTGFSMVTTAFSSPQAYDVFSDTAVRPDNSKIAYAWRLGNSVPFALVRTADGGVSWNTVLTASAFSADYGFGVVADVSGTVMAWNRASTGYFVSRNNGISGSYTFSASGYSNFHKQEFSNVWIAQGASGGSQAFFTSSNQGTTWSSPRFAYSGSTMISMSSMEPVMASSGISPYLYAVGYTGSLPYLISSSDSGNTFSCQPTTTLFNGFNTNYHLACDPGNGRVYVSYVAFSASIVPPRFPVLAVSKDNGNSFLDSDKIILTSTTSAPVLFTRFLNAQSNVVYFGADFVTTVNTIGPMNMFVGSPKTNRSQIGPKSLSTSVTYVDYETGLDTYKKSVLNNLSEFPHYGGLFQMRNIVLGTQDSGKIGTTDDSIVQINYIGSVVKVLWPDQGTSDISVKGFGELSPGQSPGKAQTQFTYGQSIDVTDFDSLSLYCYLQKQVSGTLDAFVIQVQRKPLKSIAFANDQYINVVASGSTTEAIYTDYVHTKNIDYGDLSIKEIGYTIDLKLKNVREIRIGVKQKVGQEDVNKNFIAWGRLINSKVET